MSTPILNLNENASFFSANTKPVYILNQVRESIEGMNKFNQVEVLRILHNHKEVCLNENKYGVHVNLTELSDSILDELSNYISYVLKQETTLNLVEQQKETFKNTYFSNNNNNKDIRIKTTL